jgi:hypothetical protein
MHQVVGLLGGPRPGRVRGDPQDVHPPAGDLHHEQHIQPAQGDRLDAEEVGGQQPGGLRTQERPPARAAAAGRRPDSGTGQDPADGAGADPVAKPQQFALDPTMPPQRVLPSQPEHQIANLVADTWAAWPVGVRPPSADQPPVPGQQGRRVTIRCARSSRGSSRASAASTARSGHASRGLSTWRRSTATSCRSTTISMFFAASVRASNASQPSTRSTPRYSIRTATARDHAVPPCPANLQVSTAVRVLTRYTASGRGGSIAHGRSAIRRRSIA